jgi:uncharacterized membrane protein
VDSHTYNIVLLAHILAALAFVSGIVLAGVAFEAARRRDDPADIALLLGLTRIAVVVVAAAGLLLPLLGLWLVHLGSWGYGTGWIDWALGLFVVALALGGLGGQRPKQARKLAERLAAEGATKITPQLRGLLDDRLSRAENYASLLAVLAIVAVMVLK